MDRDAGPKMFTGMASPSHWIMVATKPGDEGGNVGDYRDFLERRDFFLPTPRDSFNAIAAWESSIPFRCHTAKFCALRFVSENSNFKRSDGIPWSISSPTAARDRTIAKTDE